MLAGKPKKVLVAPLDWGLGHATRCVPVIHELVAQGCEVQVASSGASLQVLREEFPYLTFHQLIAYDPQYSATVPFVVKILLQLPKFLRVVSIESRQVQDVVHKEKIDIIISDNRYGCRSANVKNVFITHQVNILLSRPWKWVSFFVNYFNHRQIKKFDVCWVPDFENGITGKLSQNSGVATRFVGMLSRLEQRTASTKYKVVAIVSGPEPQRSLLENILKQQLVNSQLAFVLVKGNPGEASGREANEADHLSSNEMNDLIASAEFVVCRSGYSSIMDLCRLKKKAIFIPTPGQTEQEYLAEELKNRGIAFYQKQSEFDLAEAIERSKKYSGFAGFEHTPNLLQIAITDLLNSVKKPDA